MVASTWWQDFLNEPVGDVGSRTDQTKRLKQMLGEALEGGGQEDHEADLQLRRRAAYQLTQMANRVWKVTKTRVRNGPGHTPPSAWLLGEVQLSRPSRAAHSPLASMERLQR